MQNSYDHNRSVNYSVHKLIELVKARPIIWDSSLPDYRRFYSKDAAWIEIYKEIDDKFESMNKRTQGEIGMKISTKWRNIRDAFIRSLKKRAQDSTVRKYMHHDRLSFMLKLFNIEESAESSQRRLSNKSESAVKNLPERKSSFEKYYTEDPVITVIKVEPEEEMTVYETETEFKVNFEDEESIYSDEDDSKWNSPDLNDETEEYSSEAKKIKLEVQDEPTQTEDDNVLDTSTESKAIPRLPPDEDESFFASILSYVKDMTEDEKLDFRMAVLQLIHETRLKRRMSALID